LDAAIQTALGLTRPSGVELAVVKEADGRAFELESSVLLNLDRRLDPRTSLIEGIPLDGKVWPLMDSTKAAQDFTTADAASRSVA
jgi:hypothetical protein